MDFIQTFEHILWIGGATDTGKTTITDILAEKYGFQVYHYDRRDGAHIERLAQTDPRYRAFLSSSLEERWITPEPEDLLRFLMQSFQDRLPLALADLLEMPRSSLIVAEGFGLLPELIFPFLASPRQAAWLVPTEEFKRASMIRRGKPSFKDKVSDPDRAIRNVFERDMLLARHIREQAKVQDLTVLEVDGARSIEEMAARIEQHFMPFIHPDSQT